MRALAGTCWLVPISPSCEIKSVAQIECDLARLRIVRYPFSGYHQRFFQVGLFTGPIGNGLSPHEDMQQHLSKLSTTRSVPDTPTQILCSEASQHARRENVCRPRPNGKSVCFRFCTNTVSSWVVSPMLACLWLNFASRTTPQLTTAEQSELFATTTTKILAQIITVKPARISQHFT